MYHERALMVIYMHSHSLLCTVTIAPLIRLLIMNSMYLTGCVQDKEEASLRINVNGSMITSCAL